MRARGGKMHRLAGAGQRQAGDDIEVRPRKPGLVQALLGGVRHRRKAVAQPKADVGRPGKPFAQHLPLEIGTAGRGSWCRRRRPRGEPSS